MAEELEPDVWSNEVRAEFMLNNALTPESYRSAVLYALSIGVDPTKLNPDHLIQDEPWARPELYIDPRSQKHS